MNRAVARQGMLALLAAGIVLAGGCFAERHRFDAPRLTLKLDRTLLRPGEDVTGVATAIDGSGITLLGVRVFARVGTSTYQLRDFVRRDSVTFAFRGALTGSVVGDTIIVRAFAQDTDLLLVTVDDTAVVR